MRPRFFQNPRAKYHTLAALIIVFASALLFYQHIFCNGMLFYIDMDFTDPPIRNLELRLYAWDMYGSYMTLSHMQRIPWTGLFLLPALIFHLSSRAHLFFLFMGTLSLVGLNMYALTYSQARKSFSDSRLVIIGSLVAALIYMFNPIAIQYYWAFWVLPAYSFLPLVPLLAERLFKNPGLAEIAACGLAMTLFLTTPHFIAWSFLLFGATYGFLSVTTRATPGMWLRRFVAVAGVGIAYVFLNAYWLFPYVASGTPSPSFYTVTPGMIEAQSGDTLNIWRLTGSWSRFLIDPAFVGISTSDMSLWQLSFSLRDPMVVKDPMWIVGGFVLAIVAGTAFLRKGIRQEGYLIFFGLVLVVSIFLAQGVKSVVPSLYRSLFTTPVIEIVSWVFRVPQRWEFLTALSLAFLSGIAVVGFLTYASTVGHWARLSLSLVLITLLAMIGYYFYPVVKVHADTIFRPADIPEEYRILRQWLGDRAGKITWFPPDLKAGLIPTWDTTKRYNINLIWLVEHPTIATYMSGRNISFFIKAQAKILEQDCPSLNEILAILGSRYVIFDESALPTIEFDYLDFVKTKRRLLNNPRLQTVFNTEFLTVLENGSFVGEAFTSDSIFTIDSLDQLFEMPHLNITSSAPVLKEDIQRWSLPASLVLYGEDVPRAETGRSRVTYYKHLSPTAYEVYVRADKPFLLVITESYDPLWTAVVNDEREYTGVPVGGIVNGYWIEQTGDLKIRVEYKGQRALVRGATLSLLTAALLGTYWVRKRVIQNKGDVRGK